MLKLRRIWILGGLLATACLAALAPSAAASESVTCAFEGLAGAFNPPIPSVLHDSGGVQTLETGTYHYASPAVCVKADGDLGQATNSGVFVTQMSSDGTYANTICGNDDFEADDPATTTLTSTDPRWEGPLSFSYVIRFRGFEGPMSIGNVTNGERSGGLGAGYATAAPWAGGECALNDTAFFQIQGSFTVEL
jgi:hypothetical protein